MVELIAWPALLLGLYSLYIVGWPDLLRVVQGNHKAVGTVARHRSGPDGYTPVYAFDYRGTVREAEGPTAHPTPLPPVGSTVVLNFPARRPDLARAPDHFRRAILYLGFAAWLAFFSDLLFNWI